MFLSAFLLGLTGSLHCVGMCGPIAIMVRGKSRDQLFANRIVYSLGKTLTYSIMGVFVGLFGKIFQWGGVQGRISMITGLFIIAFVFLPKLQTYFLPTVSIAVLRLKKVFASHLQSKHPFSAMMTGMVNGFLPCGLVYAALAIALVQPTPIQSATIMALFGLGTIPLLFTAAYSWQVLKKFVPIASQKLQTAMLVIVAIVLMWRGVSLEMNAGDYNVTECNPQAYNTGN